ncbi:MAG: amidohydrolase family protein [Pseudomonadales bacterium]
MNFIDPHLHFFDLSKGEYNWLAPQNPPHWPDKSVIHRDFGFEDLVTHTDHQLCGFVHIEAGFNNRDPQAEIQWLERTISSPFKSVACIDLTQTSERFQRALKALTALDSVIGVRHILDEDAPQLLSDPHVIRNLSALADAELLFECQVFLSDASTFSALLALKKQIPSLKLVFNHAGFVPFDTPTYQCWLEHMGVLADIEFFYCKASGWEMISRQYTQQHLATTVRDLHTLWGDKLMLASNFPLCLFSTTYAALWQDYAQLLEDHSQVNALCYANAKRIYQF